MLCDPLSNYPDQIDDMVFFQDNSLEKADIMKHYNTLTAQGEYSNASNYINQQEGVYGYFADFFNLIENRIYSLQAHLQTKTKNNPFVSSQNDNEPDSVTEHTIWI